MDYSAIFNWSVPGQSIVSLITWGGAAIGLVLLIIKIIRHKGRMNLKKSELSVSGAQKVRAFFLIPLMIITLVSLVATFVTVAFMGVKLK